MRRAAKIDANQPEVIAALERAGAVVTSLAAVGNGVPDLLVCLRNRWFVIEVKDGRRPPSERKLTAAQAEWHAKQIADVHVVESPEEALHAVGLTILPPRWALDNVS